MEFTINPKMPTEKELQQSYQNEYDRIHKITDMNFWYKKLEKFTIPSTSYNLTKKEIKALIGLADGKRGSNILYALEEKLKPFLKEVQFAKLNTRSPKDFSDCLFDNASDLVLALGGGSMRTFEDLCMFYHVKEKCSIWFRTPTEMEHKGEWRCFVRNGELIGISQYFYMEHFDYTDEEKSMLLDLIPDFSSLIIDRFNEDDFVLYIYIDYSTRKTILIEINPYGSSDPCLFDYEELENNIGKKVLIKINAEK